MPILHENIDRFCRRNEGFSGFADRSFAIQGIVAYLLCGEIARSVPGRPILRQKFSGFFYRGYTSVFAYLPGLYGHRFKCQFTHDVRRPKTAMSPQAFIILAFDSEYNSSGRAYRQAGYA